MAFLFLIFVMSTIGLEAQYLVLLSVLPIGAWVFWKFCSNKYYFAILLVSAIYIGGVLSSAEDGGLPVTPFQVLLVLGIFLFGLRMLHSADFDIRTTGFELIIAIFLGYIFFSLIYSVNPLSGFLEVFRMIALFLFVILILNSVYTSRQIIILLTVATLFGTVLAAASVITSLLNPEIAALNYLLEGRGIASRAAIGDADPNFFATIFFIPIAFTASILHSKADNKFRVLALFTLIVLIGGALSTYSRSAWVAIFLIGAIIVYHYKNLKIASAIAVLFIVLVAFVPDLRIALAGVINRVVDIFAGNVDTSSKMRIVLGQVAIRMFLDNVFLGVGFRSFPIEFDKRNTAYGMLEVSEPHNITYMILSELGLIGIFLFSIILFFLIRLAYRNLKMSRVDTYQRIIASTLFSSLIGYLMFHQFIPRFFTNNTMYLNIALIFVHHYYLLGFNKPDGKIMTAGIKE